MGKASSQLGRRRQEPKKNTDDNNGKRKRTAVEVEEEGSSSVEQLQRFPLSEVVSDCTKRWFEDTLKEAKNGDVNMQVIVGQMYNCGYGIPKDAKKAKTWITRASRNRSSSVWKLSHKRPGYNVSDSDSDELADDS